MNLLRRHPIALALLALLLLTAVSPLPPLEDAVTGAMPGDVELARPLGYVLLAPLSSVLDALTFFSLPRAQWAIAVWVVVLAAWGATRAGTLRQRVGRGLVGPLAVIAAASAAVLLPRPVPRLLAADSAATIVDFHAHTQASHDGRRGWTPARLARWHARQGFEASYVTDHNVVFDGSRTEAIPLLPGVEWSVHRQHVIAIGPVEPVVRDSFSGSVARMVRLFRTVEQQGGWSIASLPEYWRNHRDALGSFIVAGVQGFEIVNCSPKGLAFSPAARREVLAHAARHDLLVVGASDNHGWGQVTCVWNVSYPGAGYRGNRVVARPIALRQGAGAAWAAAVTQPWLMFRSLSWSERASWMTWVVVILLYRMVPRRREGGGGIGILARSIR